MNERIKELAEHAELLKALTARLTNKAELLAEDIEAYHMAMDKAGVPRADESGAVYSMWGRAIIYKEQFGVE